MQIQLYYNGVDSYECVLFSSKGNGVPSVPLPIMCVYLLDVYRDMVKKCIYIHQVLLLITDKKNIPWGSTFKCAIFYMHPSVHCSTVYNSQDMEAT